MLSRSDLTRRWTVGGAALLSLALLLGACTGSAASASTGSVGTVPSPTGAEAGAPAVAPGAGAAGPGAVAGGSATGVGVTGGAQSATGAQPAIGAGVGYAGRGSTGVATSGAAIAYPYFGGVPGVAPDHTIVVSGYGQATMAGDASDRAKAQAKALDAAMADARSQADVVAKLAGVTITGVLSVSASAGGGFAIPMMAGAAGAAPGAEGPSTVTPTNPGTAPEPVPAVGPVQFGLSVTVAYSIAG